MVAIGIETSCDDTAVAVVNDCKEVVSNVVSSQIRVHAPYWGVVPELASREHLRNIGPIFKKSIELAKMDKFDIVAFTAGPGLIGSLLVGEMFAKVLAYKHKCRLVGVNHLEGHIFSVFLNNELSPPFLSLIVSGGHTELVIVRDFGKYEVVGSTRDDAAGEAFDKVARLLNLGYPGGPVIDELSKSDIKPVEFPRAFMWDSWDFSFAGLKTAVLYYVKGKKLKKEDIISIAKGFQQAVIETLVEKSIKCAMKHGLDKIAIVGGVAANSGLRRYAENRASEENLKVYFPNKEFCTDNAAMIASVASFKVSSGVDSNVTKSDPNLPITNWT